MRGARFTPLAQWLGALAAPVVAQAQADARTSVESETPAVDVSTESVRHFALETLRQREQRHMATRRGFATGGGFVATSRLHFDATNLSRGTLIARPWRAKPLRHLLVPPRRAILALQPLQGQGGSMQAIPRPQGEGAAA